MQHLKNLLVSGFGVRPRSISLLGGPLRPSPALLDVVPRPLAIGTSDGLSVVALVGGVGMLRLGRSRSALRLIIWPTPLELAGGLTLILRRGAGAPGVEEFLAK